MRANLNLQSALERFPIQTPILDRLGDVRGLDFFGALQVGDGAANFGKAVVGPITQAKLTPSSKTLGKEEK